MPAQRHLEWTPVQFPNIVSRYNHVYAMTPFGRILISWKGWKTYPSYYADDFPNGNLEGMSLISANLEGAKLEAEEAYFKLLDAAWHESVPTGYVMVPTVPNEEMNRVMATDDWNWSDVLAAAETATEAQIEASPE